MPEKFWNPGSEGYRALSRTIDLSSGGGGGAVPTAREQGLSYVITERDSEEMHELYTRIRDHYNLPEEWYHRAMSALPERQISHLIIFDHGALNLYMNSRLSESNLVVAQRFGDVVDFAYARFQELQEKEDRNRELEIENALERVRAQALGMQESAHLTDVSKTLFEEFHGLGYQINRSRIRIWNEEEGTTESWTYRSAGSQSTGIRPLSEAHIPESLFKAWKQQEPYLTIEQVGEEVAEYYRDLRKRGGLIAETYERIVKKLPDKRVEHNVFFSTGCFELSLWDDQLSESDLIVTKRFADVFDLAYKRFLELQEKEEQNRQLAETNRAMSEANRELFQANKALQRDRTVARLRSEVQAMEQVSDFERVLSVLAEDLKSVGLSFDTCGIEVLDEPVDEPTMAYFEEHGFRYTAYTIDPDGTVTSNSYHIPAPFPPVVLETLERFVAGEPWQGTSGETAIVEVPASNYGRLRLTSSERKGFTEEDINSLQDFASAIALGYARYLDIREIQEQTQKKSAFLASMSHELRTPMNAIKGFTSLVLRRIGDSIPVQHKENLEKVTQASDHLLAMINDILDLSKIEAGRMDVNAEPFDPKALVASCCATVSPLLEEKPDVNLEYEVAEGVEQANTDQGRIRQMLINLLSNAIKFTDSGGVSVQAKQEDGQLVLSVSDTGQGIPEDEVLTIFDEYRQVKGSDKEHKGTGLGLSITKQFAELLGGSIGVESQVGKGSTFTVRVPVVYGGE